ncbi:MAG: hypothetical protein K0R38_2028 [Polyangiaceae bacterium]|jgi:hypothetical protein|nr:hypothetical protein [Polyangiaceae bacterium]
MSTEGPQEPNEASQPPAPEATPGASQPPKKKKKKLRPPPPPPLTEEQIDSPSKQTIGMLTVVAVMTLCMWVFARGGCNYHPPKESRDPRKVELTDLARDPKDAAMEFELRWSTKSFGGAAELAKGPMVEQVKQAVRECDADASCAKKASDLRSTVLVAGQLLERGPTQAVTRVTVTGTGASPVTYLYKLEREQSIWKTVSRTVDDGTFKARSPELIGHENDGGFILRQPGMPAPASSAPSTTDAK